MHKSSLMRMEWFIKNYIGSNKEFKVLDVGSYNVNGTYRDLFKNYKAIYHGLDLEKGPNVDIVVRNPYKWSEIETESYDVVISGQAFEHIEFFWLTMVEIARVMKKNALLCIIVPNGQRQHRYPVDCYRFFTDGMVALARYVNLKVLHAHCNAFPSEKERKYWASRRLVDAMLVARKTYAGEAKLINLESYKVIPSDLDALKAPLMTHDDFK